VLLAVAVHELGEPSLAKRSVQIMDYAKDPIIHAAAHCEPRRADGVAEYHAAIDGVLNLMAHSLAEFSD